MMYIASKVVTSTETYGVSSDPANVVKWLNIESTGTVSSPFSFVGGKSRHEAQFYSDLLTEIGTYHVPAMVAAEMVHTSRART